MNGTFHNAECRQVIWYINNPTKRNFLKRVAIDMIKSGS